MNTPNPSRGPPLEEVLPSIMSAVLLVGHGGFEKLQFRTDVPVPRPEAGEVLIRVLAAAVNNTDINTQAVTHARSLLRPIAGYSVTKGAVLYPFPDHGIRAAPFF